MDHYTGNTCYTAYIRLEHVVPTYILWFLNTYSDIAIYVGMFLIRIILTIRSLFGRCRRYTQIL